MIIYVAKTRSCRPPLLEVALEHGVWDWDRDREKARGRRSRRERARGSEERKRGGENRWEREARGGRGCREVGRERGEERVDGQMKGANDGANGANDARSLRSERCSQSQTPCSRAAVQRASFVARIDGEGEREGGGEGERAEEGVVVIEGRGTKRQEEGGII